MRWAALIVLVAACGHHGHHAVDPALELSIVAPDDFKRVEVDFVTIERSPVYADAAAFAADLRAKNSSHQVGTPTPAGDGWVADLTEPDQPQYDARVWYRPLGDGVAIWCMPVRAFTALTADDYDLTAKICAGIQRADGGVFVPFRRSRTDKSTHVELAVVGGKLNWSVELLRPADAPPGMFPPLTERGRPEPVIDHGALSDGEWTLYGGPTSIGQDHFTAVTRRTIGGTELACIGDGYQGEAYTRRELALCEAISAP